MNRDFETLSLAKNQDSETTSYKNRDCKRYITTEKTRLQDPWISSKISRDPEFLKDHSPPLAIVCPQTYIVGYIAKSLLF